MGTLDLILRIVSTLATCAIGIAAALLAYRQYKISHTKLKFDLYERRLALLTMLMDLASRISKPNQRSSEVVELVTRINTLFEHEFLFDDDPDITARTVEMGVNAVKLHAALVNLENQRFLSDQEKELEDTVMQLQGWFAFLVDELPYLFKKHMSLKTLK